MRDLSLHVIDIVQNALVAGSTTVEISYSTDAEKGLLRLSMKDDGRGMTPSETAQALSPFYTSRTTRKEGLGLPLFKMAAQLTGGDVALSSQEGKGTCVTGEFYYNHINMPPLGDTVGTFLLLLATNPHCTFSLHVWLGEDTFSLSTQEVKKMLGDALPLSHPQVQSWMRGYLTEQLEQLWGKNNPYFRV